MRMTLMLKQYKEMNDICVFHTNLWKTDFAWQLLPNCDPWNLWWWQILKMNNNCPFLLKWRKMNVITRVTNWENILGLSMFYDCGRVNDKQSQMIFSFESLNPLTFWIYVL
jgi:hypothetical protein